MMRFLADENFDNDILRGVLRRNPALDVVRVQDTEAYQAEDTLVLAWAARENRILLTRDIRTMPDFAYERVAAGQFMPGVLVVSDQAPIGQVIADLLLIIQASEAAE
jgi:predicted nuclease of predicted toxin-antitoxin system